MKWKLIKLEKGRIYPICPECGKHTIVLFTPPHPNKIGIDWERSHIYCCNGEANCQIETRLKDLTTPLRQPK